MLGSFVKQRAYTEDRMTEGKVSGQRKYQQAYHIYRLMGKEASMKSLLKVYKKLYNEEID